MSLQGILGIKKVFMREDTVPSYNESKGGFERNKEWVLDTDGVNLEEVMQIPEVDFSRVQSNDVVEILNVMGIEGVRKALLFHVRMVISFDGSYVNYRHLGTLCDAMTQRGHLMAITRHGVNRTNLGPLMKMSFEETVEILMDAAIYAEVDYMRAVSENILFGQCAPVGTGVFDLYMDDKRTQEGGAPGSMGVCAMDYATPTLPHMKDSVFLPNSPNSPGDQSPLPPMTPSIPGVATPSDAGDALPTPNNSQMTPGDEDSDLGRLGSRSPFSVMGATPFSSAGITPGSSPATPGGSDFRSPSYTPASESPAGTSPGDADFSPSYASMASPAYTPAYSTQGTSSPSYHSFAGGQSSHYKMDYSPTSYDPGAGTSPMSLMGGQTSPATDAGRSPHGGFAPTSPVDTPLHAMGTSSPGAMSPQGEPFSPVVQSQGSARAPQYQVDVTSPVYTPHGEEYGGGVDDGTLMTQGGSDVVSFQDDEDSDEDAMMAELDHEDEGEETEDANE